MEKEAEQGTTPQGLLGLHVPWEKVQGLGKCWGMPYLCLINSDTLSIRHCQEFLRFRDHLDPKTKTQDELNSDQ